MIASGFQRLQVDRIDSRLIHYLLEHTYLWIGRAPGHRDFWNPPFFYPAPNTAAYTDLFLSLGPPYWLYRVLGIAPDPSFGLWMITMSALNFGAGMLLFRGGIGLSPLASAAGSYLVAFGAPRINQLGHQQLLPCFYVLVTVYSLSRVFRGPAPGGGARWKYWMMAAAGWVLQFHGGVYLAWFLAVGAGLTAAVALVLRSCRGTFLRVVRRDLGAILTAVALAMIAVAPLVGHYLPIAREVAPHVSLPTYRHFHPHLGSWLNVGPGNFAWGWTTHWPFFQVAGQQAEHHLGIGLVTTISSAAGLYARRGWPICRLMTATGFAIWAATTFMPTGPLTFVATGAAFFAMAGLFWDREETRERALGVALMFAMLLLDRIPAYPLESLSNGLIVLCLLEVFRAGASEVPRIVAGLTLALVCLKFFACEVMMTATEVAFATAAVTAILLKRRWWAIGIAASVSWLSFVMLITYLDNPRAPLTGLAGVGGALAVLRLMRHRPPARLLTRILAVALPIVFIYSKSDSLWLQVFQSLPGGIGIRVISRVVLILLIPAALGLALLVERFEATGRRLAAVLLIAACAVEQATATGSYDVVANRNAVEAVARRVDPACEAFYYRPCERREWPSYHIDAMWASLVSGRPTVNGYSGYEPPGWHGFFLVDTPRRPLVADTLEAWAKENGLKRDRIQWIGEECPGRGGGEGSAPDIMRNSPDGLPDGDPEGP